MGATLFEILVRNSTETVSSLSKMEAHLNRMVDLERKMGEETRRVSDSLRDMGNHMDRFRRESERSHESIIKLSRGLTGVGQIIAGMRAGLGFIGVNVGLQAMTGLTQRAAAVGGVSSIYGATLGQGFNPLETGGQYLSLKNQLVTATRSSTMAHAYFERAKVEARQMPMTLPEVTELVSTLQQQNLNPFRNYSTSKAGKADKNYNLLKALGDISGAYGKTLGDAQFTFGEYVSTGATASLQGRFKINPAQFLAMARSQGGQINATTLEGRAGIVQQFAEATAKGGMQREMETVHGKLSNMSDYWSQFLDMVSKSGPYEKVLQWLDKMLATLEKMFQDGTAQKWADNIGKFIEFLQQKFEKFFNTMFKGVDSNKSFGDNLKLVFKNAVEGIIDGIVDITPTLVEMLGDIMAASAKGLLRGLMGIPGSIFSGAANGGAGAMMGGVIGGIATRSVSGAMIGASLGSGMNPALLAGGALMYPAAKPLLSATGTLARTMGGILMPELAGASLSAGAGIVGAGMVGYGAGRMIDNRFARSYQEDSANAEVQFRRAHKGVLFGGSTNEILDGTRRQNVGLYNEMRRRGFSIEEMKDMDILASDGKGKSTLDAGRARAAIREHTDEHRWDNDLESNDPLIRRRAVLNKKLFDANKRKGVMDRFESAKRGAYESWRMYGTMSNDESIKDDINSRMSPGDQIALKRMNVGTPGLSQMVQEMGFKDFNTTIEPIIQRLVGIYQEIVKVNDNMAKLLTKKFEIEDKAMSRAINIGERFGMTKNEAYQLRNTQADRQVGEFQRLVADAGGVENLSPAQREEYRKVLEKQQEAQLSGLSSNPFQRDSIYADRGGIKKKIDINEDEQKKLDAADQRFVAQQREDDVYRKKILDAEKEKNEKAVNEAIKTATGGGQFGEDSRLNEYLTSQKERVRLGLGPDVGFSKSVQELLGDQDTFIRDPVTGSPIKRSEMLQKAFNQSEKPEVKAQMELVTEIGNLKAALEDNTKALKEQQDKDKNKDKNNPPARMPGLTGS